MNMVGYALWNIYIKVRYLFKILFTYQKIKEKKIIECIFICYIMYRVIF